MKLTVALPFAVPARTLAVLLLGASLGGFPRVAQSQTTAPDDNAPATVAPDTNTPADTDTNTDIPPQVPPTNGGYGQKPNHSDARAQIRQFAAEQRMRDMMAHSGITATATQDAILTFLRDDEENKRSVRDAGRKLWNGMRRDVPAERLRALLGDYQKALQTARDNRQRAQTALDARVGYSLDVRLESMLWLLGVLGEGQTVFLLPPSPQNPLSRGPHIMIDRNALAAPPNGAVAAGTVQVEGVVNAKNSPQDTSVWLEIRDANGRLWRMVPSSNPDAQPILVRQIGGLSIGDHVLVRLATPAVATPTTPYSLLALANQTAPEDEQGGQEGTDTATEGQYK